MTTVLGNFFFKCGTNYIKAHVKSRAISEQRRKPEKIFFQKLQPQFLNFLQEIFSTL